MKSALYLVLGVASLVLLSYCSDGAEKKSRGSSDQAGRTDKLANDNEDNGDLETSTTVPVSTDSGPSGGGVQQAPNDVGNPSMKSRIQIFAMSNPGDLAGDSINLLSQGLSQKLSGAKGFSGITSIQSGKMDAKGDYYFTADAADGGILCVIRGLLAELRSTAPGIDIAITAEVVGIGLSQPKGLDFIPSEKLVLVADVGSKSILAFDMEGSESEAEYEVTDLGDNRAAWDVHYDAQSDAMWAAGTDGTALYYKKFKSSKGKKGPDAEVIPTEGGEKVSVNLHGIVYLADKDILLLTDVGSAQSADDGQFFIIEKASKQKGDVAIKGKLEGDLTRLGNPVDLEYANGSIYIAEKTQDLVLRFDDALKLKGAINRSPEEKYSLSKVESVHIIPE